MKCRSCKRDIPENSLYCNWCGEKQIKEKKKKEISVPKPQHRSSGLWIASMMINGTRTTVSAQTEAEYYAKARALKAGLIAPETPVPRKTLDAVVTEYIASRQLKSPSTLRGYSSTWRNRFLAYHNKQVGSIDYQKMVNAEASKCSPKTLANAWGLVSSALKSAGYPVTVTLGAVPKSERPWLSGDEIPVFLDAIRGHPCELAALLALHSLRLSEVNGLTWDDIEDGWIRVHTVIVRGEDGMVEKPTPKNESSDRRVPIFIPRLQELLDAVPEPDRTGHLVTESINTQTRRIKKVCAAAGLPCVTMHGLRHSFASLCHRLQIPILEVQRMGGWKDYDTLREIYTHLDYVDTQNAGTSLSEYFKLQLNYNQKSKSPCN